MGVSSATEATTRCASNPYDELNYRCLPVEWTAPERLALASLLHGGPRPILNSYRVLELGCGDGANLLPLAYYRRHATLVGVDGARSHIGIANQRKANLGLTNVNFLNEDFSRANDRLSGQFDFIIAHGIYSWVSDSVRNALFELCAQRLQSGGLLYLNYNTKPGWNVRGMVREFLLAQTAGTTDLRTRAQLAKEVSARVAASLPVDEHPYSQLLANEYRFVCDNHVSYVAHEYLAAENHAYWRSEFMSLAARYGFEYVGDADFNYASGRTSGDLAARLEKEKIVGRALSDTADLLSYRQLHTPILAKAPLTRHVPNLDEFADLRVASCLVPCIPDNTGRAMYQHPSGYQVEAKETVMQCALNRLLPIWPRGLPISEVFPDVGQVRDDLELLHRNGLIELRCVEPGECGVDPERLNRLEASWGGYITTAYHTLELPVESNDAALGTMKSC